MFALDNVANFVFNVMLCLGHHKWPADKEGGCWVYFRSKLKHWFRTFLLWSVDFHLWYCFLAFMQCVWRGVFSSVSSLLCTNHKAWFMESSTQLIFRPTVSLILHFVQITQQLVVCHCVPLRRWRCTFWGGKMKELRYFSCSRLGDCGRLAFAITPSRYVLKMSIRPTSWGWV